jgi:hypothetical protein
MEAGHKIGHSFFLRIEFLRNVEAAASHPRRWGAMAIELAF